MSGQWQQGYAQGFQDGFSRGLAEAESETVVIGGELILSWSEEDDDE